MFVCFRLFEEAATKLNLVGLVGFLQQLRKSSQSQLFDSVTETGDYSLAMPGIHTQPFIAILVRTFTLHNAFLAFYSNLNHHMLYTALHLPYCTHTHTQCHLPDTMGNVA